MATSAVGPGTPPESVSPVITTGEDGKISATTSGGTTLQVNTGSDPELDARAIAAQQPTVEELLKQIDDTFFLDILKDFSNGKTRTTMQKQRTLLNFVKAILNRDESLLEAELTRALGNYNKIQSSKEGSELKDFETDIGQLTKGDLKPEAQDRIKGNPLVYAVAILIRANTESQVADSPWKKKMLSALTKLQTLTRS